MEYKNYTNLRFKTQTFVHRWGFFLVGVEGGNEIFKDLDFLDLDSDCPQSRG